MSTINKKALPIYEENPALHIKKLREFLNSAKRDYVGEDQALLIEGIETKIKEVQNRIDQEDLYDK